MTKFEARLALAAGRVEARLEAILDEQAAATPGRLMAAMRHAVLGGGKRFRPFLVLETAELLGGPGEAAANVAAALECVHCYSLVHDDLPAMDNDELRRGRPTVWKAFDEWTAILAGDALLTLAFEILARTDASGLSATAQLALVRRLAAASGPAGMVGGQALDLAAEKLGQPARPGLGDIQRLQAMKTGALLTFACEAGAIAAGADAAQMASLRTYGEALGTAFQLSDDLLDTRGDSAVVGKAVGKDAGLGKATVVSLLGVSAAERMLSDLVNTAVGALA
ncbi:MAG TPA: farnesyl diphosphate synthase, partial [Hyphomicrobiaceae bacterium]|nr:farnesyl diphosphate synthase [Hyphomicrobiaceae bacterium]